MTGSVLGRLVLAWVLATVLVACTSVSSQDRPGVERAPVTMTVATLNLYHDRDPWPPRLPLVLAGLRELDADVIALQEVIQRPGMRNQAEEIGAALGYKVHFVSTDPPASETRYGNALLTRHPVLARDGQPLEPLADSRTVACVRIDLRGTLVHVFATHLHHTEGAGAATRSQQVAHLLRLVAEKAGTDPVVLLGDFNAIVESVELVPLLDGFADAYGSAHPDAHSRPDAHTTLNPAYFDQPRRIDHIYAQRGRFDVQSARLFLNQAGPDDVWPSDHFGVTARLRLVTPTSAP